MPELAIVALTPHGQELGGRIAQALGRGEVLVVQEGTRARLEELFRAGRPLVCIMALGIVVRLVGPLAQNKQTDPAVVVVDGPASSPSACSAATSAAPTHSPKTWPKPSALSRSSPRPAMPSACRRWT
jgi:hypothetical protein